MPGQGKLLQEYTDSRFPPRRTQNRPLEETPRGRLLLQMAWRYGFVIVSTSRNGVRLRYVGEAMPPAMTCLGLNFAEYLTFLAPAPAGDDPPDQRGGLLDRLPSCAGKLRGIFAPGGGGVGGQSG